MSYRLRALSGAASHGAHAYLLELDGARVLLDCGASQGDEPSWLEALRDEELPDVVWLSHAHWDHLGALPRLRERAPRLPVLATPATRVLGRGVLASGLGSGQEDRAASLMDTVEPLEFHRPCEIAGLTLTATPSGHLAGAAALVVEGAGARVGYSGDVSQRPRPGAAGLDAAALGRLDLFVLEGALAGARGLDALDREAELARLAAWLEEAEGPALCAVAPFGEAAEVVAALLRAGSSFVVHDGLRAPLTRFAAAGALESDVLGKLRFADTSDCRALHAAGARVVAPGDQLQPGTPAGELAGELLTNSAARIALLNAQSAASPGGRLARAPRRSRLTLGGRRVRVKARVERFYLPLHATRPELVALATGADAARIALFHGGADALHDLRRELEAAGAAAAIEVLREGEEIEG